MVRGKIEKKMVDVYKRGTKSGKKNSKGPNQKKKNSRTKLIESIVEELWPGAKWKKKVGGKLTTIHWDHARVSFQNKESINQEPNLIESFLSNLTNN